MWKKFSPKFSGMYRGKVVDNADSSKLGRIKVQVQPMLYDIAAASLPWAIPAFSVSEGAISGYGSFSVPVVNSYVWVFFEQGDIYQPVYFAEAPDTTRMASDIATNYPNRKVISLVGGIKLVVDKTAVTIRLDHPSGSYITIVQDGTVTVHSAKNVGVDGKVITVQGETVNITGSTAVNINP